MKRQNTFEYQVALSISRQELLKYYRGSARQVVARTTSGQNISFPVDALKPYVTHNGVRGVFRVIVSSEFKLIDIQQVVK